MKKIIFAILMTVLIVLAVPATAFAAPSHRCPPQAQTITAEISLMAVGSDLNYQPIGPPLHWFLRFFHIYIPTRYLVTGTTYYEGIVTDSSEVALLGAAVVGQEDVHYIINEVGDVLNGNVSGTVTLTGSGENVAVIDFWARVWGNIFIGPAGDDGVWRVDSVYGDLSKLKRAKGTWTAYVEMVPTGYPPPNDYTFAGTASIEGTYR
jgi:hypothetical protein